MIHLRLLMKLSQVKPKKHLTPEQIEEQALAAKAQSLMGTLNAFKLEKTTQTKLNSSQARDVQDALNELANEAPDKALVAVQRVINDPDFIAAPNSAVWVLRGDIHRAKNENQQAIEDYQTALSIIASNYQAHNRLGLAYRNEGEFDLAKQHYTNAIEAWPGNADSYRNRGILLDLYVGDKAAALEDYKIYKALLDFQIQSVEAPPKSLVKEQKLARQWILDIERQIKALQREQANG
jgi:tetratricopeptide (TPR) repeat protein